MKFENMKMESESDESKSEESMDEKFNKDKVGFMSNATRDEHHTIDEAFSDGETIKYSSIIMNKTKNKDEIKTTAQPEILTTLKKGKQLELLTRDGENINASIPNAAEVWALAGMRKGQTNQNEKDNNSNDVELFSAGLNNTAKNLLDWTEITKMNNESAMQDVDEKEVKQTTVMTDIDDPATSENKGTAAIVTSKRPTNISKSLNDNELENGNIDFGAFSKSSSVTPRIDSSVFSTKNPEENAESVIELIDPRKKSGKKNERLTLNVFATTESVDNFTTDSPEAAETTTTEIYEMTTSIVDSFTVIGEDGNTDDIYKRTITELPESTIIVTTTQTPPTTTNSKTTTEVTNPSMNEIPESTQRYNKSTKSIRATTTETPERLDSTLIDNETIFSTLIPKYTSSRHSAETTKQYEVHLDSSSSPTEIVDDDKFKYGTLLPEATTTTMNTQTIGVAKSGGFEEATKKFDSLNKESLDGSDSGSGNLGLISASVSIVILLIIVGVTYVSVLNKV